METIVLKADEVMIMFNMLYPEFGEKLTHMRTMHKNGKLADVDGVVDAGSVEKAQLLSFEDEVKFSVGSRESAVAAGSAAAKQASRYNALMNQERVGQRGAFYDHNTQITHLPCAQMLRAVAPKRVSRHPMALMENQHMTSYKRLRTVGEANEYVFGTTDLHVVAVDGPSSKRINAQKERVKAKIRARHQGQPDQKAMRKAARGATCGLCQGTRAKNKFLKEENLVSCATCPNTAHPSCLQIDNDLTEMINTYEWQCIECKVCSVCRDPGDEEKMLFCDCCDRGYHTFCVGLKTPPSGRWVCSLCGLCASCGATTPGDSPKARWRHEYDTRGDEPRFLQTLCQPCSSVFREGDFCASCLVVYRSDDTDLPMVCCDKCDRWVHTECDDIDDDKYEDLSEEGSYYECLLCRGEQPERYDAFHKKYR